MKKLLEALNNLGMDTFQTPDCLHLPLFKNRLSGLGLLGSNGRYCQSKYWNNPTKMDDIRHIPEV